MIIVKINNPYKTMLEVEIKILEVDEKQLTKRLEELGAVKTFGGVIHDVYYDFPEGKKLKMEGNKRMFRIRKKGEEHIYTIKRKRKGMGKQEGAAIKDEHETPISNIDSFQKVIEKYGMTKTREKIKNRTSYKLAGAEFDIDTYEDIPAFLEIEEESRDNINFWLRKLGLVNHDILIGGSRKIFKHYGVDYLNFDWKDEKKD